MLIRGIATYDLAIFTLWCRREKEDSTSLVCVKRKDEVMRKGILVKYKIVKSRMHTNCFSYCLWWIPVQSDKPYNCISTLPHLFSLALLPGRNPMLAQGRYFLMFLISWPGIGSILGSSFLK